MALFDEGRTVFFARVLKLLLRVFGALVSASFAVLTCKRWLHPEVADFWEFCHFIGQTLLGVFVGLGGCYAELKGSMSSVTTHFRKFALNRIGLSIFYFWLGCYVMGGDIVGKGSWKWLAHGTGIISWVVATGDLLVAGCSEQLDEENEDFTQSRQAAPPTKPVTLGREGAPASAKAAAFQGTEPASQAPAPASQPKEPHSDLQLPAGGWNSGGGFGSV